MTDPTRTLIDTNVLLDLSGQDSTWRNWSEQAVTYALARGVAYVNPIIYAELSVRFETLEKLEEFIPAQTFVRDPLPFEAAFLAGKAFKIYRQRGGAKHAPLPDFYIGAHAMVRGYRLLTRDTARFRTYFPKLEVTGPE
jgi:predicted nucleic acid-binding protein